MISADLRSPDTELVREALAVLDVQRLVLGLHDSAFPPGTADCGYGSPHASGDRLLAFVQRLGFDGLQLGPGGQIADANLSPYDATAFARNVLCLDIAALCAGDVGALLTTQEVAELIGSEPPPGPRAQAAAGRRIVTRALELAYDRFVRLRAAQPDHPAVRAFDAFCRRAEAWLPLDALFEALCERLGHDDPSRFEPALQALFERTPSAAHDRRRIADGLGAPYHRARLAQWLLDAQMRALRTAARAHGIALFGDLQIGWSTRDRFLRPELFAPGWVIGAPPSRTNPDGQPWGYPLLDPDQLDDPESPARRAFATQLDRAFALYDGLRIDHPHGLVCPWIYSATDPDPQRAVVSGTRAFESPDREDATLQRWAIARREDLDPSIAERHADLWVRTLDEAQITRYGRLVSAVLEIAQAHGRDASALAAEVLSTCPTPLRSVLDRHGLGRFVVTQKARPGDPRDVYRTERARTHDWAMLGTHDTPPIFPLAEGWIADGTAHARAAYLARRLEPDPAAREAAARHYCASPSALVHAELADVLACAARNVFVCFTDLFGELEPLNRAGVVHADNWRLRLPADYERAYASRRDAGRAIDFGSALSMALHARGVRSDLQTALSRR